jgi:hypothetical protein
MGASSEHPDGARVVQHRKDELQAFLQFRRGTKTPSVISDGCGLNRSSVCQGSLLDNGRIYSMDRLPEEHRLTFWNIDTIHSLSHCSRSLRGVLVGGMWLWWLCCQCRMPTQRHGMVMACRWQTEEDVKNCNLFHASPHATSIYGWFKGHFKSLTIQVGRNDFYKVWGAITTDGLYRPSTNTVLKALATYRKTVPVSLYTLNFPDNSFNKAGLL